MYREKTLSEQQAHLAKIARIVADWQAGIISLAEKREQIAEENYYFHGDHVQSLTTNKVLTLATGEAAHVPSAEDERREQAHVQLGFFRTEDEDEEEPLWWKREA